MALIAYNKTTSPLALAAGHPIRTLPASASPGTRGPGVDVTTELKNLQAGDYTLIEAQRSAGDIDLAWTGSPEYELGTVTVTPDVLQTFGPWVTRGNSTGVYASLSELTFLRMFRPGVITKLLVFIPDLPGDPYAGYRTTLSINGVEVPNVALVLNDENAVLEASVDLNIPFSVGDKVRVHVGPSQQDPSTTEVVQDAWLLGHYTE